MLVQAVDGRTAVVAEVVRVILERGNVVTPLEVLIELQIVDPEQVAAWRSGSIPYLERAMLAGLSRVAGLMGVLHSHALSLGLTPIQGSYRQSKSSKKRLRFSKRGDATSEQLYTTHFVRPKPAPVKPDGAKSDGIKPDGAKPEATKPANTKPG